MYVCALFTVNGTCAFFIVWVFCFIIYLFHVYEKLSNTTMIYYHVFRTLVLRLCCVLL